MKPLVISAALTLSLSTLCSVANAAKLEDVAPYPKAEAGFTRQFEAALRGMWQAWCAQQTGQPLPDQDDQTNRCG